MLTAENNELLTRTGPTTPMGKLIRRFWLPFLRSDDLMSGGGPLRVRLLGEDLVAYRDGRGRVGLLQEGCPHRGAPLIYARNEMDGLRCMFHGWSFDCAGSCIDMPTEEPGDRLRSKVRATAYACEERNGIVWAFLGPQDERPALPEFEWNMVPEDQVHATFRVMECNWFQALEGDLDSAHAGFLHDRVDGKVSDYLKLGAQNRAPSVELDDGDFGTAVGAKRSLDDGTYYLRVNHYVLPCFTLVPAGGAEPDMHGHTWVPMDDKTTLVLQWSYKPVEAFSEKKRQLYNSGYRGREGGHPTTAGLETRIGEPFPHYWPAFSRRNDYGVDRVAHSTWFSSMPGIWVEDAACQAGVKAIADRTAEHLASTDAGLIRARRCALDAARAFAADGTLPPGAKDPSVFAIRPVGMVLNEGDDWRAATSEFGRAGGEYGYEVP